MCREVSNGRNGPDVKVGTDEIICRKNQARMLTRDRFWWTLVGIGWITIASGVLQCIAPGLLLQVLSPDVSAASKHFLGITGVFTAAFGALLVNALVSPGYQPAAVMWTGIQKIVTAAAVGLAIQDKIFSPLALGAAAFDLVAGVMIIAYWFWIKELQKEQTS